MSRELLLKHAAKCLAECGYEDAADIQFAHDAWGVFVPEPEIDHIWIEVDPFEDSLEGRQQLDVLIGHFCISTTFECEFDGWYVECWAMGLRGKKDHHITIYYPVKYEGKYRREAELRCVESCLSELAGVPCPK